MSRAVQTVALRVGASVAAMVLVNVALTPVHADSTTPAFATQHAIEEIANAVAQGKITLTPTPSPTVTATPTLTVTPVPPTLTPLPDTPTATPTPEPCWLIDQDMGDPDNGYIVFDEKGVPVPCPTDQPPPTDEPTPDVQPSAVLTETPVPARPAAPPAPVASQPVAAVAPQPTEEPLPTYTLQPTYTPYPTFTPVAVVDTSTPTPTVTPSVTSTPRPVHIALVNPDRTDHRKVQPIVQQPDRTAIVLAVLGVLLLVGVLTAIAWRWRRAAYLKALAQLP